MDNDPWFDKDLMANIVSLNKLKKQYNKLGNINTHIFVASI